MQLLRGAAAAANNNRHQHQQQQYQQRENFRAEEVDEVPVCVKAAADRNANGAVANVAGEEIHDRENDGGAGAVDNLLVN